jgi:hypothetical protein
LAFEIRIGSLALMTSSDESRAREAGQKVIARALKERRRFRRVNVAVTGRLYIPATQEECICTVEDISPGDASLLCQLREEPKGRAVIYLDTLGRFEGPIVRAKRGSFVMTFTCSLQKREKLADQLMLEMNRHLLDGAELRRFDRVDASTGSITHFTRSTGDQIRCEVIDLSLSGVSLRSEFRPPLGEHVLIGHRAGRVARHHEDGIGIEFLGTSLAPGNGSESQPAHAPSRPLASSPSRAPVAAALRR